MLNFASHELNERRETNRTFERFADTESPKTAAGKILADKIIVPSDSAEIERPRLHKHLKKSLKNYSATLITGRAGTGKTAFAADFARRTDCDGAVWYKTDTTDTDWTVFLDYLSQSLHRFRSNSTKSDGGAAKYFLKNDATGVTESLAAAFAVLDPNKPLLVVLDDLHTVFDADWFAEFFDALLSLPPANVRLLMIARAAPPFPLWRLRSKQVLDVIDEKLMSFTLDETVELFRKYKLPVGAARAAHKRAYGKVAALKEICRAKKSE